MKLLLVTAGAVLASKSNCNTLPKLGKSCDKDFQAYCSDVDPLNLVGLLKCAKTNQGSLQAECLAEIQKDFPADYSCADDLTSYCPSFGQLMLPSQWAGNDDDDDDDDDKGRQNHFWSHHPTTNSRTNLPVAGQVPPAPPAPETTPALVRPVSAQPAQPTQQTTQTTQTSQTLQTTQTSSSLNALHKSKPVASDDKQCFRQNFNAFSAPCRNAIAEQWAALQTKKGAQTMSEPSADEAYAMMAPAKPEFENMPYMKVNRTLFIACIALFACAALTCLCCCCKRCKKRRAARRAARQVSPEINNGPQVALSPLPEAVVVHNAGPVRYVPLAAPVSVPLPSQPISATSVPYTGKGLTAYVPMGYPVNSVHV